MPCDGTAKDFFYLQLGAIVSGIQVKPKNYQTGDLSKVGGGGSPRQKL